MKKKSILLISIIIIALLLISIIVYFVNYKNIDEIKNLLSQSNKISNMYVEHFIDYGEYSNNIKDYKVEIFVKDNVYVYNVLGRIDYVDYNANESYSIENNQKTREMDISQAKKFNDYSEYFNSSEYKYTYNFPILINNTWCDKITLKNETTKIVIYINKNNGLVMKKEVVSQENKAVETFNYQLDIVTEENIKPSFM